MNIMGKKFLVIFLCLLVMALPFSSIAIAQYNPQQADSQMPCHQIAADQFEQACPETGSDSCECCQFAMPGTLMFNNPLTGAVLFNANVIQVIYLQQFISQPQIPPFRPPRFAV